MVRINIAFIKTFFKEYSISFLLSNYIQVNRLCTCGSLVIVGLLSQKLRFSIFPVLKGLNKINHSKPPKLVRQLLFKQCQQKPHIFFWLFTENLTILLPVTRCAGHNTDLPANNNISNKVRENIALTRAFFKEYSIIFLMISRLIDFALVVL